MAVAATSALYQPHDQDLIDRIMYVASLVSDPHRVGPILDTVREVTAKASGGESINDQDRRQLEQAYDKLVAHVTTGDPVRSFTRPTLQRQVDRYFDHKTGWLGSQSHRQLLFFLVLMNTAYLVTFGILQAKGVAQAGMIASTPANVILYIGMIWFYVTSLSTFTPQLRRAYAWICAGIITLGTGVVLWMPFSVFPEVFALPFFHYGGAYAVIGLSFLPAYHGTRLLAKQLGIQSVWLSWKLALAILALAVVVVTNLPHVVTAESPYLNTYLVSFVTLLVFGVLIGLLSYRITKVVTPLYAQSIAWFGAAFTWGGVLSLFPIILFSIIGPGFGISHTIVGLVYAVAAGLCFTAGYKFKRSSGES